MGGTGIGQTVSGGEPMKIRKKHTKAEENLRELPKNAGCESIITDPNGSYTGRAQDPAEKPIQDADDL